MSLSISPPNRTNIQTYSYHNSASDSVRQAPSSPKAPAYSPITPKVQPVLPANYQPAFVPPDDNGGNFTFSPVDSQSQPPQSLPQHARTGSDQPMNAPRDSSSSTQYIPHPPNLPFSSEDATDAIALRAAISTLQFQKKKAQDDIRTLSSIKQLALDDPSHFRDELAAGRLSEQRPKIGDLKSVLDESEDSEEDSEDEDAVLGAFSDDDRDSRSAPSSKSPEIPDSQPSQPKELQPQDASRKAAVEPSSTQHQFPRIPGPQDVVRMPHVNWDKYGILGEPLESMHAQQQKWPGTAPFGPHKGREYTIAAPYSPFLDQLEDSQRSSPDGGRKDSGPAPSATGTISEHVMETRSRT